MSKKTEDSALTASNLKDALWQTLNGIRDGSVQPAQGDAIAAQAREIIRLTRTQCQVAAQSNRPVPAACINFSES